MRWAAPIRVRRVDVELAQGVIAVGDIAMTDEILHRLRIGRIAFFSGSIEIRHGALRVVLKLVLVCGQCRPDRHFDLSQHEKAMSQPIIMSSHRQV
jgi:hypothetical protein